MFLQGSFFVGEGSGKGPKFAHKEINQSESTISTLCPRDASGLLGKEARKRVFLAEAGAHPCGYMGWHQRPFDPESALFQSLFPKPTPLLFQK